MLSQDISKMEIESWLQETDEEKLALLWQAADDTRQRYVGDVIHLRGLLEISNYCVRKCTYCGINKDRSGMPRYRLSEEEIMLGIKNICELGYGTVVMQAGEDYGLTKEFIANVIRKIKATTPLAVTLSLGERPLQDLIEWKNVGADRYLLRFETSNKELYRLIHPPLSTEELPLDRFRILKQLQELGYEVGSGVMVGIPGQSYKILANDIDQFRAFNLDMIGVGPYIVNPQTMLGAGFVNIPNLGKEQVQANELMTYKVIALTRLVCPEANIPSTTALATINRASGRELGLRRGANVVMLNVTPEQYRTKYELYPSKVCIGEVIQSSDVSVRSLIKTLKRTVGYGSGSRKKSKNNN